MPDRGRPIPPEWALIPAWSGSRHIEICVDPFADTEWLLIHVGIVDDWHFTLTGPAGMLRPLQHLILERLR